MQIQEAILHRIKKAKGISGAGAATVEVRTDLLAVDERLERTAADILRIYGKATSGYGTFDADEVVYTFPVLLRDHVLNGRDHIPFSQDTTRLIAAKMGEEPFATGGYALFLRYTSQEKDWLLVAMLKLKPGTGIDEQTLELSDTLSFDIDHLHEAARIDLAKWQANTQPYLSFVKKRQGGEDVSRYFREALGCTEYTDSKHNTSQLMAAVDDFCETQGWTPEQRYVARNRTYEYCEEKDQAGEPVNLTALSAHIFDQQPAAFAEYVREQGYEISETFKPHKTTYSRFKRINGKVGSIKVSFDVADLLADRVDYDVDHNFLIIRDIPQDLVDLIHKHKPRENNAPAD